jgi:ribonuclease R
MTDDEAAAMEVTGELISQSRAAGDDRRARDDRPLCRRLPVRAGRRAGPCRITGVQPFGFFATVEALGGDGLVPVVDAGQEYFRYDEASQR